MKRLIVFTMLIAFSVVVYGQDFVTKTDFQAENQKLTEQINAAKAPAYELKAKLADLQINYDSIAVVNSELQLDINALKTALKDLENQQRDLSQTFNESESSTIQRIMIHDILLLILVLVSLVLLILLWLAQRKKFKQCKAAIDKLQWELGLHTKSNEEQLADVNSQMKKWVVGFENKLQDVKSEIQSRLDLLDGTLSQKVIDLQSKDTLIKEEMDAAVKRLDEVFNGLKATMNASVGELKTALLQQENILKKQVELDAQTANKLKDEMNAFGDKVASLEKKLRDHQEKQHQKE